MNEPLKGPMSIVHPGTDGGALKGYRLVGDSWLSLPVFTDQTAAAIYGDRVFSKQQVLIREFEKPSMFVAFLQSEKQDGCQFVSINPIGLDVVHQEVLIDAMAEKMTAAFADVDEW